MVAQRMVDAASRLLARRIDRRGLLARAAVVGSAVTTSGLDYVLRPGTAYASVCGSGASCGSGWTAMCCTINHGVNQCPPNSFAGGWWKADGASLCGGSARYYVDCQAECTKCGCGGGAFCGSQCWDCKSHCADGSCDKRAVCRNVFRYGQCNRDRGCSGPVMCRTITCSPPWHWADCSSVSATDNATRTHSASCLTGWTHIARRYTALGSQGSALGATIDAEYRRHDVSVQRYQHGRMYWTEKTGAHYLTGDLASVYVDEGEMTSSLGLPTSDPDAVTDGHVVHCQNGGVYQHNGSRAHAVWGGIYTKWQDHGGLGTLGWPTSSLDSAAGGHYVQFQRGGVYHGPNLAVRVLTDPINHEYRNHHTYTGVLGWPRTGVETLPDKTGHRVAFVGGEILSHSTYGTWAIWGPTDTAYDRLGAQAGVLGYPTTTIEPVSSTVGDGTRLDTVGGVVTSASGATDAYAFWGHIAQWWSGSAGNQTEVGLAVADMTVDDSGDEVGRFERAEVRYDSSTGRITVTPTPH